MLYIACTHYVLFLVLQNSLALVDLGDMYVKLYIHPNLAYAGPVLKNLTKYFLLYMLAFLYNSTIDI